MRIRLPGTAATASEAAERPAPSPDFCPVHHHAPAPTAASTTTSNGPSLELFRDLARSSAVITSESSSSSPISSSRDAGAGAAVIAGAGVWVRAGAGAGRRVGIGAAAGSSRTSSSGSSSMSSSPPNPPGAGASSRWSSSVNSTAPRANWPRCWSGASETFWPPTRVPLVLPRSLRVTPAALMATSACWPETDPSVTCREFPGRRPTVNTPPAAASTRIGTTSPRRSPVSKRRAY